MKIRTQFRINIILLGIILLLVSTVVIVSNRQLENTHLQDELASQIEREGYELGYLANDYLLYREPHQAERWQEKFASFSADLSRVNVYTPEQQALLTDIQTNRKRLETVFAEVRTSIENAPQTPEAGMGETFLQVSWSRLEVQTQGMIFNASRLERMLSEQEDELTRQISLLNLLLIGGLGVFLLAIYWSTFRRTLGAIATLQDGTSIIGSGDLDFAIPIKNQDEIGELSHAFNQMATNLKQVTASKADLEKEITERRQAQAALQTSEAKLRAVFRSLVEGVVFLNPNGDVEEANEAVQSDYGHTMDELTDAELDPRFRMIRPDGTPFPVDEQPAMVALRTGEAVRNIEMGLADSQERTHWRLVNAQPVHDEGGTLLGAVASFFDITERKRAEEALRASEERLRRFYDSRLLGMIYWNMNGEIIAANDKFLEMTGYTREDMEAGRIDWVNMTPPEYRHLDEKSVAELKATGVNSAPFEKEYIRRDGTRLPIIIAGVMLDERRFEGVAFVLDITARKRAEETLRKKEAEIRSLYESMTELFVLHEIIYDTSGKAIDYRILECNPAFEKITGIQRDAAIGGMASRVYGTGEAPYLDIYARVAEVGEPVAFETEFSPMGKHFHISVFSPERGRFATLTSDITERRQAEAALRRFELLSANSKDIILFMRREDGCILEANAAAMRTYGYSRDELLGLSIRDLRAPDTLSLTADQMAQADAGGILFESIHRRKDGSTFPVEVSSQGATIGGVRTLISIVRDITERKQTEEVITSLSKFPGENPNPILRVQNDGRLIYANAASQELLEWWDCKVEDCLPAELKELIAAAVDNHVNKTLDQPCNDKVYSIMLVPIVESGYVNIYGRDITERKQAEEVRQRLTEDLRRSNAELEQFAYVASHDLQEPLRMVSNYVQLLARRYQGKLDSDADDFIAFAVDGARRMQNLINDLLAFSRVGTRSKPLTPVSAEDVLNDTLANLQFLVEESGASITHEPLPVIRGDASQLVLVFQNLLGNAIKFRGSEPPSIHIGAKRAGNEWIFSVRDNGIGLDLKFAERIFVIFQRLHDRSSYPGTGIGLAICKRIIQRHDGRIWVESKPGEGATFYFTVPVKETV